MSRKSACTKQIHKTSSESRSSQGSLAAGSSGGRREAAALSGAAAGQEQEEISAYSSGGSGSPGQGQSDVPAPEPVPAGKSQRFIKNNQYFTICIYAGVMVLIAAVIFKCVIDFDKTREWLRQMFGILSPFMLGALLAYVLNPMVHMFYRGISRLSSRTGIRLPHALHTILAILITYMIVVGFVVLTLLFVLPEIARNLGDFVNYLPTAYDTVFDVLTRLQERFPNLEIGVIRTFLSDAMPELSSSLQDLATNMVPALYTISMSIVDWVIDLFVTLIVSIYMLYDKRRLMRTSWRILYAFVPQKHMAACQEILAECNRLFSNFVVGKFIDSLIIGVLCFILMSVLRLPYTPLISIIVGVTNMIPYFGPFIGAVPGVLIMLFIRPVQALVFSIMILCLQQFDGLILGPKIIGNSTGMKPLWIIFAITVGGQLAGVIGMFLGVPVVAILSYLFDLYLAYRLKKKKIPDSVVENVIQKMGLDD